MIVTWLPMCIDLWERGKLSPTFVIVFVSLQLQVFDSNKDGRLQLSEMAK